jgi:hypothetical protein
LPHILEHYTLSFRPALRSVTSLIFSWRGMHEYSILKKDASCSLHPYEKEGELSWTSLTFKSVFPMSSDRSVFISGFVFSKMTILPVLSGRFQQTETIVVCFPWFKSWHTSWHLHSCFLVSLNFRLCLFFFLSCPAVSLSLSLSLSLRCHFQSGIEEQFLFVFTLFPCWPFGCRVDSSLWSEKKMWRISSPDFTANFKNVCISRRSKFL